MGERTEIAGSDGATVLWPAREEAGTVPRGAVARGVVARAVPAGDAVTGHAVREGAVGRGVVPGDGSLVAVVGARGGLGASTLSALLARRLSRRTATVLVDLAPGAGLDVLLGMEDEPGPRWPDLTAADDVPGEHLLAALPRWGRVAVLSGDRHRPVPAGAEVLAAVASAAGATVVDVPLAVAVDRAVLAAADLVVVVAGGDFGSVGGAVALAASVGGLAGRTGLVLRARTGGLGASELELATGWPVLARLPHRRSLTAATARGALGAGGAVGRAVGRLAGVVERSGLG